MFGINLKFSFMFFPFLLVTLTALLKNKENGSSDKLELALEVLALLAMVYFTVFMLLPF